MRKTVVALLGVVGLLLGTSGTALAYEPVNVVHTEQVQVGPYALTVGFSTWPVKALQSLDFTFVPEGGIEGRTGTLAQGKPGSQVRKINPLVRHPRKLEVWGLDVKSLSVPGDWRFEFTIDGADGPGSGVLVLPVHEQPGPPMGLSWAISSLPLFGLVALVVVAWRRTREDTSV
ncbi:hypothetical protein [Umezawaea tangerina]|uniref:Methionine-rich copper-binding protein CopC n=1 Tax=Umezawaea tangerina TaxID=84725 RepID=A0A2T0SE13_9PSEU|nr:hypothetical protein [Umezawaea tangerina]PRY31659.1 hypothetical protein CLV43_12265 [Umezawaea tangerina]